MDKKHDYRLECLELLSLPDGTPDSVILKNLQSQLAKWHPDKNNFTDLETRHQAEDKYKKLNELRQGLKLQKEREKIENGIVVCSENSSKEDNEFISIYEVLDLKIKLNDAKSQIEKLKDLYDSAIEQTENLKKQLAYKNHSEVKEKIEDIKHIYKPKSLYRNISFGSLLLALTSQVGFIRNFLLETLGLTNGYVLSFSVLLACLFLLKYLYNLIALRLVEEMIGYFTNPNTIKYMDKGKYLSLMFEKKIHVFEETDFFDAVENRIKSSKLIRLMFYGHKETIKRQIVDTIITDLFGKKIISMSYVYEGGRTFKIEESDYVTHMDKGF